MWKKELEDSWEELAEEVLLGIKEWRLQHPKATLKEIEEAVDASLAKARARLLQDVALASEATKVSSDLEDERLRCGRCDHRLESRGQGTRSVTTYYDQRINLKRSYMVCPACGTGVFPPG
ncbi:MAG: hypothetical protein ACE5IG_07765 [Dehalococcoidia bacterium]